VKISLSKSQWKQIGETAGWEEQEDVSKLMRPIRVTMSDGDIITTQINGTRKDIEDYYLNHNFVKSDETTFHHGLKVEFLEDDTPQTQEQIKTAEVSENIVPASEIIGTSADGMSEAQIDEDMHSKGYFLFREYYPWGRNLSYQSKNGEKVYLEGGKWMTWEQLKQVMREEWRPARQKDQDWYNANLG